MKLKRLPEDFFVEEVIKIRKSKGNYSIYKLQKRGANTLDVLLDIAKKLRVNLDQIGYAGLKDRHAVTVQYISIENGPQTNIKGKNYNAIFLHTSQEPISRKLLIGNIFRITIRDITQKEIDKLLKTVEQIEETGFVNYYGPQRFGSAKHGKGFVAKEIIKRNYEKALRLLIATWHRRDESRKRKLARCVAQNWKNWKECLNLAYGWEKKVLNYLCEHPEAFNKVWSKVPRYLKYLLACAYQSFIWNKAAAILIKKHVSPENLAVTKIGISEFWFYNKLSKEEFNQLSKLRIPLPHPFLRKKPEALSEALRSEGITLNDMKVRIKGFVFKGGNRNLVVKPQSFSVEIRDDDLYENRKKIEMNFFLPKGSFASVLLARLKAQQIQAG